MGYLGIIYVLLFYKVLKLNLLDYFSLLIKTIQKVRDYLILLHQ